MDVELTLYGLDEWRQALLAAPEAVKREASQIVVEAAARAEREAYGKYPTKTGNLRAGLTSFPLTSAAQGVVSALVINRAKHAYIYEHGTVARHTKLNEDRGVMPNHPVFLPAVDHARAWMVDALATLLREAGFEISGAEAA